MVSHSLLNQSVSDHGLLNWSVSEKLGQREGLALDSPMFYGSAPDI